jgi:hypothetical protein
MQRHGKHVGPLSIIVRVALVATRVRILQGVQRHADVRGIFVIRSIIAAMAGTAALFARVDGVPLALLLYRVRRRWHVQHDGCGSSHCATAACGANNSNTPIANMMRDPINRARKTFCVDMSASLQVPRLLFRLWLLCGEVTFGWAIA